MPWRGAPDLADGIGDGRNGMVASHHSHHGRWGTCAVVIGAGLALVAGLCLTGCLGSQVPSDGDDGQTEEVRFSGDDGPSGTATSDMSDGTSVPDGEGEDGTPSGDASEGSPGDLGDDVTTEDVPVTVNADTVAHSNEIAGSWKCSCIVEEGEEAFQKEISMSRMPTLVLDEGGTGTMSSDQGDIPVKWSVTGDLARIERATPIDTGDAGDGLSGQAWITRNKTMIWHVDGDPDDVYTRWITEEESNAIAATAPTAEMLAEEPSPDAMQ